MSLDVSCVFDIIFGVMCNLYDLFYISGICLLELFVLGILFLFDLCIKTLFGAYWGGKFNSGLESEFYILLFGDVFGMCLGHHL